MPKRDLYQPFEQNEAGALSLRGAMRGEILPIAVTATSKRFAVPATWKGYLVRIHADGGDVYYQISTGTDAACDVGARAQETGNPIALTPSASGNGCVHIPNGGWLDVPFPKDAQTFALISSGICCARAHLSET
jgi:hypothetical protein